MTGKTEPNGFDDFMRGYLTAALRSSSDTDPVSGEDVESLEDYEWGEGVEAELRAEALIFFNTYLDEICQYVEQIDELAECSNHERAGHDLWLTRNGHGVGFWDRGLGELGKKLTEACGWQSNHSQIDLYLGDDNKVYAAISKVKT